MEILNTPDLVINPSLIEEKINNGYTFDLGNYLSQGWEIYKKEWLTFSIYSLLLVIILVLASFTIIGLLFVYYPLYMGYFIGANKVERGENLSLGDMFGGFKKLPEFALLTLIPMLVMGLVTLPFMGSFAGMIGMMNISVEAGDAPNALATGAAMGSIFLMYGVMFVVGLVMSLALFFAPYLILFGDYSPIDALKTSWRLSIKQPLMIILFVIVMGFIAQVGTMLCGIGVFASMGFAYVCYYPAIKDILFNHNNTIQEMPLV